MDSFIEKHREDILRVTHLHGGEDPRVFGSHARYQAGPKSDLDLLIRLRMGHSLLDLVAIKQDLEDVVGCEVHLVTEDSLSPHFRSRIIEEAVAL